MFKLEDLKPGISAKGISSEGPAHIVSVEWHGSDIITLVFKDTNGKIREQIFGRDLESRLDISSEGNSRNFLADPQLFKLATEAKRITLAYLFDPLLAVHASRITPYPHQITAVYDNMLPMQPLRFLLADDPGAGKTIMTGLLIKELMVRGVIKRCLIVVPGGLAVQWQDELFEKFNLDFELMTRDRIENSRTGNPFTELNLVIARLDQLSRDDNLQGKAIEEDWDLVIIDEAHKMAAHFFGKKISETKRYKLGKLLRDHTRHLLLLTATPHNGKEEDFQLFLALLDKDRFEGRFRNGVHTVDTSDVMRRMVKEDLLKFDETKLFPQRIAYTKEFSMSPEESELYDDVTNYVKEEFNKAESRGEGKKNVVGFALTILQRRLASSPEAIYKSLKRRRERLHGKLSDIRKAGETGHRGRNDDVYRYTEEDIDDYDDNPDQESEEFEERIVDQATASETISEFEKEIQTLRELEKKALKLKNSGNDSKWEALREILTSDKEMFDADGVRRKLILFTEHRDTLSYLENRISALLGKPEAVLSIHGDVKREDRKIRQDKFTQDKSVAVLLATDAAGEGINLQRASLMINYDLPWNPNRIEQRFGRIHRIGQTEVCFLWNLIAADTREGDVFITLFNKLEEQRKALDGRVFDVLGKVFREKSLREMLLESIRYGEDPMRKEELRKKVRGILDLNRINESLKQHAIGETSLSKTEIQAIKEDLERANARKLQPHFISAFFVEAFRQLGGSIYERENLRYEIRHVPAMIKQVDMISKQRILSSYERVCFDKELVNLEGKPTAAFLCQGHPLFDAVLKLTSDKYSSNLTEGTVLIETTGKLKEPALLFQLEHEIDDERELSGESKQPISKQLVFVYYTKSCKIINAGFAPHLDCRAPKQDEVDMSILSEEWIKKPSEKAIIDYALTNLIQKEFNRVKLRREEFVQKTKDAVKDRLTKEILYWDNRYIKLKEKEETGKERGGFTSSHAKQMADELDARLKNRLTDLEKQLHLINRQPFVVGSALVIPEGYTTRNIPTYAVNQENKTKTELIAMEEVMRIENTLGRIPTDVHKNNYGWDIESMDAETKKIIFIEVKGRVKGADTVTVSSNEIRTGKNISQDDPTRYILAIVEIENDKPYNPKYVKDPFSKIEVDFSTTSINFDLKKLLAKSEDPA